MLLILITAFLLLAILLWAWSRRAIEGVKSQLQDSFKAISFDVMEKNSRSFVELAKGVLDKYQENAKGDLESRQKVMETLLQPVKEQMAKIEEESRAMERRREGAYASLHKQIGSLIEAEKGLRTETSNLVRALRSPNVRGSWGQLHLRRVVELAGMLGNCDFYEQKTLESEGRMLRPDLIVHLPGNRLIAVDAKTPLDAYLEAIELQDEGQRVQKLKEHALALRSHIKSLAAKEYWRQFPGAPEYVILFLPAEAFFSAALEMDSSLIELGASNNVIVATPTTLIAILRAVALGWKQESLSRNAEEIANLGKELYERLGVMVDHWIKLGKALNMSVESYNQAISSLEARVLVSARKLKDSGVIPFNTELKSLEEVEKRAKTTSQISTL